MTNLLAPMQKSKRSVRRLNRQEAFIIYEMLKKNGVKKPNNIYQYNDGWDDYKIAETVGNGVTHWCVKSIRNQSFGIIYKQPTKLDKQNLSTRIDDLESKFDILNSRLSQIVTKIRQLDGINKVSMEHNPTVGLGNSDFE